MILIETRYFVKHKCSRNGYSMKNMTLIFNLDLENKLMYWHFLQQGLKKFKKKKKTRIAQTLPCLSLWHVNRLKLFSAPRKISSSNISMAVIQLGLQSLAI